MTTTTQRDAAREASRPLAEALGQRRTHWPGYEFRIASSRAGHPDYQMIVTPELAVVHQGLGCEGEFFGGVRSCRHSKESETIVTQAVTTTKAQAIEEYKPLAPKRIEFTNGQLKTIAEVVCRDYKGELAPPAFVQLFVSACIHSGLDPFLKQIYALHLSTGWAMYVGIDGYRVVTERTGLYQGMDGPYWSNDGEVWYDYPFVNDAAKMEPKYCKVLMYRKGMERAVVSTVTMAAHFQKQANNRWQTDPAGMLAKCAEMLGHRRLVPGDMAILPKGVKYDEPENHEDELPTIPYQPPTDVLDGSFTEVKAEVKPACEHEAVMDDDRSILICGKCKVPLEGPDAVQAPALPI